MAKKRIINSPEEKAYQELLKKAFALEKSRQVKEGNQRALQVGKGLAMFFRWLQALEAGNILTDELAKVWLVQILKDYPSQHQKALAYYDSLKKHSVKDNFKGFQVRPDSLEKGELCIIPMWMSMELSEGAKGEGSVEGQE